MTWPRSSHAPAVLGAVMLIFLSVLSLVQSNGVLGDIPRDTYWGHLVFQSMEIYADGRCYTLYHCEDPIYYYGSCLPASAWNRVPCPYVL